MTPMLLGTPDICALLGIERHTWRRWVLSGRAPAPVRNLPGHPRWRRDAIEAFAHGQHRVGRQVIPQQRVRRHAEQSDLSR